jgi:hypothetical protein
VIVLLLLLLFLVVLLEDQTQNPVCCVRHAKPDNDGDDKPYSYGAMSLHDFPAQFLQDDTTIICRTAFLFS